MAHSALAAQMPVIANTKGFADPDGPILHTSKEGLAKDGSAGADCDVHAASIVVLRGKLAEVRKH